MNRLSVVIPFRDRHDHLSILAPHLREYATINNIDMEIIIVEQADELPLRRGALRNEGVRISTGDVIALHDVDYLPEMNTPYWKDSVDVFKPISRVEFIEMNGSPRKDADVPSGYRKFKEQIDDNFFGGVLCITRNAFLNTNGYNPMYEGWGLEDDDFRERIYRNKLLVASGNGTFKALPHKDSFKNDQLFKNNQYLFATRDSLTPVGMNFSTLTTHANTEKAHKFNVDVWLEVSQWNIPGIRYDIMEKQLIHSNRPVVVFGNNTVTLRHHSNETVMNTLAELNYTVYEYGEETYLGVPPIEQDDARWKIQ